MKKENQSLLDFLSTMPSMSFLVSRSPLSNKEAQAMYDIWLSGQKDEYGKNIIPEHVDHTQVISLTSKGYIRNIPNRFTKKNGSACEFTQKGKDVIQKIILHKEKSAFVESSKPINFEAVLANQHKSIKIASILETKNWLERLCK